MHGLMVGSVLQLARAVAPGPGDRQGQPVSTVLLVLAAPSTVRGSAGNSSTATTMATAPPTFPPAAGRPRPTGR
ncbi:hypothetical protein MAHJHV35_46960 [Mycobacterium avium subsp. hominissuis]